jgi:hypothetical protein
MTLKMLAGAAAVAALIATPAMAKSQDKLAGSQQQSADQTGAKKMNNKMKMTKSHKMQTRHMQVRESNASIEQRGSGFPPLDFAAGVAGGAVATAGAIAGGAVNTAGAVATAPFTPFRGDSYAYYRDTSTIPNRGYLADANGPSCLPGQMTTILGHRMVCQ